MGERKLNFSLAGGGTKRVPISRPLVVVDDRQTPVKVHVSRGRLDIEAVESERVPKAEVLERIARISEGGLPKHELDALVQHLKRDRID